VSAIKSWRLSTQFAPQTVNFGGGILAVEFWRWNFGGGILAGGILAGGFLVVAGESLAISYAKTLQPSSARALSWSNPNHHPNHQGSVNAILPL